MQKNAIVIPCYKEGDRLKKSSFFEFLQTHPDANIFFVDDGSQDNTANVLLEIQSTCPEQVQVLTLQKNYGKAYAVRHGLLAAKSEGYYTHIGYFDADLSTDIREYYSFLKQMQEKGAEFAFGSRIKKLSSKIERSFFRHVIGRIIATIVDAKFNLGIYDTQCGAKWFTKEAVSIGCNTPFKTKWLFDVEIFIRIRSGFPSAKGIEIPLNKWKDPGNSKINVFHLPGVLKDIFSLLNTYQK